MCLMIVLYYFFTNLNCVYDLTKNRNFSNNLLFITMITNNCENTPKEGVEKNTMALSSSLLSFG